MRPTSTTLLLCLLGSCGFFLASCGNDDAPAASDSVAPAAASTLIRNVRIVDGTGEPPVSGAVRISGDTIAAVGDLEAENGETVIDGHGLVLAPGFIDTHSHADLDLLDQPAALPAVTQGITTIVVGQDGDSNFPLADYFAELDATPVAINVASYIGHNTLRGKVLGKDYRRRSTPGEVGKMAAILEDEMKSGALGLSSGLEYEPGIYSDPSEVLALAKVAAKHHGRYISHVRSEDRWFEKALDEIIEIGRQTGMPVQVSHIKLAMKRLWGKAPETIEKLNAARAEGIDITADIYPYEYWQSNLMVLLPERNYDDRAAVEEALDQIAPPDGIWMTQFDPSPAYVGMTLTEIARQRGEEPAVTYMYLAKASETMEEETGHAADAIIGTSMKEADIRQLMMWPYTNICTDGAFDDLHPRARGTFPRILGRYVREDKVMSIEEAVHKMSQLAARHMGFTDRGVIAAGQKADLVLFDPDTIIDRATPENPDRLSVGMQTVWIGGKAVYNDGADTGARPGVVIRRSEM